MLEYIPGVLLSDFNAAYHTDPARVDFWCDENNFDRKKAGLDLLLSFSRQLFEDNFYHADLHPGNILLLRDSKVALIDIGSAGTVEADLLRRFFSTVRALATQDYYKTADLMISFCPKIPLADLTDVTEELVHCLRNWEIKVAVENIPFHDKTATFVLLQMVELMTFRYKLPIGWSFLKITRSWCNLESSVDCLNPKFNSLEGFRLYFAERDQRLLQAFIKPKNIRSIAVSIPDTLNEYRLFVEPRIRKASRVMQLSLKRTDQIIVGTAKLVTKVLSITICYLLFLLVILYSAEVGRPTLNVIRQIMPERTSNHFLRISDQYASWVNRAFGEPLSQERIWMWFIVPIGILLYVRRNIHKFVVRTGDSDVRPYS